MIRSRGRHRRLRTSRGVVITLVLALMAAGAAIGNVVPSSRQGAGTQAAQQAAAEEADCGFEWTGWKVFSPGESYVGCDGAKLTFQAYDGNLVIQGSDGKVRFATNKPAAGGRVVFQGSSDGNLLVQDSTGKVVWATNAAAPGGRLVFRDNLDVFTSSGLPAWWSNRGQYCKEYSWAPGKVITPGEKYVGCTGDMLTMQQSDGNLVYYNQLGEVAWATNVTAKDGRAVFQTSDGNFVVFNAADQPVWNTGVAAPDGKLSFGPGVPITVRNSANELAYAQVDPAKQAVHDAWQKAREDLNKAHSDGKLSDDKWQQARKALDEAEAKALAINSKEPCTNWREVVKALSEVAATLIVALGPEGSYAAEIGKRIVVWLGVSKSSVSLLDIVAKCGIKFNSGYAVPLDPFNMPVPIAPIGSFGITDLIGQGPVFVWVDLVPVGQDAVANVYFEGDSGFIDYDYEYVDNYYTGGSNPGTCFDFDSVEPTLFCTNV